MLLKLEVCGSTQKFHFFCKHAGYCCGFRVWSFFMVVIVGTGRFDRQLYVGPPDEVAREKIFKIQLRNTPYSPLVDLAILAARTPSYTGADISAVCRQAAMVALEVC